LGAADCLLQFFNDDGCIPVQGTEHAMKAIWLVMLLMVMGVGVVGCEIDGDADDDGARLEVDVDE